jgi:hypothetical protein
MHLPRTTASRNYVRGAVTGRTPSSFWRKCKDPRKAEMHSLLLASDAGGLDARPSRRAVSVDLEHSTMYAARLCHRPAKSGCDPWHRGWPNVDQEDLTARSPASIVPWASAPTPKKSSWQRGRAGGLHLCWIPQNLDSVGTTHARPWNDALLDACAQIHAGAALGRAQRLRSSGAGPTSQQKWFDLLAGPPFMRRQNHAESDIHRT